MNSCSFLHHLAVHGMYFKIGKTVFFTYLWNNMLIELIQRYFVQEWKIGPTVMTLFEHLFVSFAIRLLRRQCNKFVSNLKWAKKSESDNEHSPSLKEKEKVRFIPRWGISKFVLSGILAYIDGRLCRCIPNPVARRVVSGFLLSYIDQNDNK